MPIMIHEKRVGLNSGIIEMSRVFDFFDDKKPRIIGHRGAAGMAPENTFVSFRRGLNEGADYIEMDVRESRDGEILIFHDATLERTTNGQGEVRQWKLKELKTLDAGYRFTLDDGVTYPYKDQMIEIPTLEEFFSAFPGVRATIEIKQVGAGFAKKLFATIRKFDREGWVLLSTAEDGVMREVRKEIHDHELAVATGLSYGEVASFFRWVWDGGQGSITLPGQALQIPCTYGNRTLITEKTVRTAHDLGLEVYAWTINDIEEMRRLLRLGVDGIVTDYPARLRDLSAQTDSS
jgi:glycerophosphoryl diester phosphodiesterase